MKIIIIIGLMFGVHAFAQESDEVETETHSTTVENDKYVTNIYNIYNKYQRENDVDPVVQSMFLQILKNLSNNNNSRPYGCVWSSIQVQLPKGGTIPFYQCR